MSLPDIPIPDLRFESTFRKALEKKAKSNAVKTEGIEDATPAPITPLLVIQVIINDVIVMPLLQGIIWSSVLLVAKPWLTSVAQNGRAFGIKLFSSLGLHNVKRTRY